MGEAAYKEAPWIELIDGKVFMMSPRPRPAHTNIAGNIYYLFQNYLWNKPCRVYADGVDVYLDEKNHFIPDVLIICDKSKIHTDAIYGAPDLVVEVLSPRTEQNGRTKKPQAYARAGVKEYWLVSPLARSVEVYLQQDGQLVLDTVYHDIPDWEYEKMEPEGQAEIHKDIKVSLYDDLVIHIRDVFHKDDL